MLTIVSFDLRFPDNQNRYVLFSIGNIKPLLQAAFPQCWSKEVTCNYVWIDALDYLEICGIIVGTYMNTGSWYLYNTDYRRSDSCRHHR
jgi:hypothetical protein